MRNFFILVSALDYIESHLTEPIGVGEAAAACYCSASGLQKLFRLALHVSVKEYIGKRRLTEAAKALVHSDDSITDIAFRYRYNSPEVFTRAFTRLWGQSPSAFRARKRFTGLFPRINYCYEKGANREMTTRQVDISELYATLSHMRDTFVLCFDIVGLVPINEISYAAGDKAILTAVSRIEAAAGADMLLFRIGGDEFALVTGLKSREEAEEIADRVTAQNGECFTWEDREIPLSLWASSTVLPAALRYSELFTELHRTILAGKPQREPPAAQR